MRNFLVNPLKKEPIRAYTLGQVAQRPLTRDGRGRPSKRLDEASKFCLFNCPHPDKACKDDCTEVRAILGEAQ